MTHYISAKRDRDCSPLARPPVRRKWGAAALVRLFERSDALRKPVRFARALQACESDARGRPGFEKREYPQAERLRVALTATRTVDAGAIAPQFAG